MEKLYYTAKEVAEMLDVSVSHAYKVIRVVVWQHTRMRLGGHGMSPSTTTIGQVKTKES